MGVQQTELSETVLTSKFALTPPTTSLTPTMLETMVFRVRQVLTHEAPTSNHVSTFTPMSMCFRVKCLMLWSLATKTVHSLRRPPLLGNALSAFMKYTLYDGPDALIANKLLEMGISINPGNVDWYKRTLIQSQSAAPMMA